MLTIYCILNVRKALDANLMKDLSAIAALYFKR